VTHYQPTPLPDVAKELRLVATRPPSVEAESPEGRALRDRVEMTRERLDLPPPAPPPVWVRLLRVSVAGGGIVWIVDGFFEGFYANVWLAGLPLTIGLLSLALWPTIGRTRTDSRLVRTDRPNVLVWAWIPVGAIALLFRIAWLAGHGFE
jgi:hypothetical protein